MAKADWVKPSKTSGSGKGSVDVTSTTPHTGRVARSSVLLFKAANVEDEACAVNQAGKPEYVDVDDAASSPQAGKVVTIAGVSNSKKLTFSLGTGVLNVSLPANYIANSISTANGAAIAGDPGAQNEYPFSISITVPANDSIEPQSRQIIVTDEAGHQDVCLLTLAAGEPYITLSTNVVELDWQGTPVTIEVDSNTSWTVE